MAYQLKIFGTFLLALFIMSCEKVDLTGMFVSDEPVNHRFEQSMEWNTSHPYRNIVVSTDNYFIMTMSDSHVGGTENLDIFFERAITEDAAAIIGVGDLTTGQSKDYAVFQEHIPNSDALSSFFITGNHDLYFDGWKEFYSRFGSSTYLFTIQTPTATDLYVCLDTGGGTLGSKQVDWLKEILQTERSNYRRCVLITHNNLFRFRRTASTNPLIEELHVLMDLFTKYEVDMVITGHDHKQHAQVFGYTTHIIMDALQDIQKNAGYFQLYVKNGSLTYRFVNL